MRDSAEPRFNLGVVVRTIGVEKLRLRSNAFDKFIKESLERHSIGDWGDVAEQDRKENEYALGKYLRLFSTYGSGYKTIWIITEADRSITTILLPYEY